MKEQRARADDDSRGNRLEVANLLYYYLLRLSEHPDLEATLQVGQDATFFYPSLAVLELVQCKKREDRTADSPGTSLPGETPGDLWRSGRFEKGDLVGWLESPVDGSGTVAEVLRAEQPTYLTLLLNGELSSPILRLDPSANPTGLAGDFDPEHVHSEADLVPHRGYRIGKQDDGLSERLVTLRRVRAVRLPISPGAVDFGSHRILIDRFGVAESAVHAVVRQLTLLLETLKRAHDANLRRVGSERVREILATGALGSGAWVPAERAIGNRSFRRPADRSSEGWERPGTETHVERPEYANAWRALEARSFVVICGDPGAGKTTLLYWLLAKHRRAYPAVPAYYLAIQSADSLAAELEVLERHLDSETLFVIDDEQNHPEAVERIAARYLEHWRLSKRCKLVVTSVHIFGVSKDGGTRRHPLNQARDIRLDKLDGETAGWLSEHVARGRLTASAVASIAGGNVGLATLACQSASLPGGGSPGRIGRGRQLAAGNLRTWILGCIGHPTHDDTFFEREIVPHFTLAQLGVLPLPRRLTSATPRLLQAGFLEEIPSEASEAEAEYRVRNARLASLVANQNQRLEIEVFGGYLDVHPDRMAALFQGMARIDRLASVAKALLDSRRLSWIVDTLTGEPEIGTPGAIARLLRSVEKIDGPTAERLLRDLIVPRGEPNLRLIGELFLDRRQSLAEVTALLSAALKVDHRFTQSLATTLFAGLDDRPGSRSEAVRPVVEAGLALCTPTSARLGGIGAFLGALHRCSISAGEEFLGHLTRSHLFAAKVNEARIDPLGNWQLLAFCEGLRPFGVRRVREQLDEFFTPDGSMERYRIGDELGPTLYFLTRLSHLNRRRALQVARRLFEERGTDLEALLNARGDLQSFLADLRSVLTLSRRVGVELGRLVRPHFTQLARGCLRYDHLGLALDFLSAEPGLGDGSTLLSPENFEHFLREIVAENEKYSLPSRFLISLARTDRQAASWFSERLGYGEFLGRIHNKRLYNWSYLIRGLLAITDEKAREASIEELLRDRRLRGEFRRGIEENSSLMELAFAVEMLSSAGLDRDGVRTILGFDLRSQLEALLRDRISREKSFLHLGFGLWLLARYSLASARAALEEMIDGSRGAGGEGERAEADAEAGANGGEHGSHGPLLFPEERPRSLADVGYLLQVSGSIDPDLARSFSLRFHLDRLASSALRERNLGRVRVFLEGLQRCSFRTSRDLATRLASPDVSAQLIRGNTKVRNLIVLGRALSAASREAGGRFAATLHESLGEDLPLLLDAEVDLTLTTGWLKLLRLAPDVGEIDVGALAACALETLSFDSRSHCIVDCADALLSWGRRDEALELMREARKARYRVRRIHRLREWIDLYLRVGKIAKVTQNSDYVRVFFAEEDSWHFNLLLRGEGQPVVSALAYAILQHQSLPASQHLRQFASAARRHLVDGLRKEPHWLLEQCGLVLLGETLDLSDAARIRDRIQPWELGLLIALTAMVTPEQLDRPIPIADLVQSDRHVEEIESALDHLPSVELALTLEFAAFFEPLLPPDLLRQVREQATERAGDEARRSIQAFLQAKPSSFPASTHPHYLKVLLQETVLRATYLPWDDDLYNWGNKAPFGLEFQRDWSVV